MPLTRFSRKEFLSSYWDYQPGEHVATIQPSQGGKTHWNYELAGATDFPKPPVALVIKAVDPTPAKMGAKLGWKEIHAWPPPKVYPWQDRPPGYNLWPKHNLTMADNALELTQAAQEREFRKLFLSSRKGGQAIIAGELYGLLAELHLRNLLIEAVSRGSSARSPIWYDTQKPSGTQGVSMPGQFFNCPTHLFLGYDPVETNRKRFSEIGGINTQLVMETVSGCRQSCPPDCAQHIRVVPTPTPYGVKPVSELLYINKNGPRGGYMCIIGVH
jgi:hypothetical protein